MWHTNDIRRFTKSYIKISVLSSVVPYNSIYMIPIVDSQWLDLKFNLNILLNFSKNILTEAKRESATKVLAILLTSAPTNKK